MATLYSLEESLESAVVTVLSAEAGLSACRIVAADESDEDALPSIAVRAERDGEVLMGMQTWQVRLTISLTSAAYETPQDELDARRVPDADDDDTGAAGHKALVKIIGDLVDADSFITALNATEITFVHGIEWQPTTYENTQRTFKNSINLRVYVNEAYPS
jgi:hypothetical protein